MLQYFYDDESGVVDISLRCRLYRTQVKSSAEEGEASISTLIIDDPDGDLIIDPFRQIYIVETAAPSGEQVVYRGYVSDREIRRGPYRIGAGREWVVQLSDPNWLIGLRIVVGSDANRPAETDLERVQWLLTTTEANTFNGDDTYVNTTATTFDMDAADYRGQNVSSILDDCAQASGKNWWVVYFEAIGQYGLWYDFPSSLSYVSPLSLANTFDNVDNVTTFAISEENTVLERSPSRLVSGVYLPYDGGYVYVQNSIVGSNTIFRDASAPSVNVKTSTKATARANRYLADNDSETDVIRTEVLLPEAQVNDIMQGQRLLISASHLPEYETPTWTRVLNRTVTETSEEFLTVGLELSPITIEGVPSFFTATTQGACQIGTWPLGPPPEGALLVGYLCQRDVSTYDATIVPVGMNVPAGSTTCSTDDIAGTEWTFINNFDANNGVGQSAKLTLAYRDAEANEPAVIQWGGGLLGGSLSGTARPRSHQVAIEGLSGAPTVTATGDGTGNGSGAFPYTSEDITVPGAGYIFAGFALRIGFFGGFMAARAPAVDLTQGLSYGGYPFDPYSWFGYLRVASAGTYNIVLDKSPTGSGIAVGWVMGFWPE